ncbi:lipoprotein insertase outer membrane protein LolB [Variovorax dokdonensis]|uniref:Outer-membrane lipoprotein LolB n=1 Tax=Variovorax dokdonensis TaxID=344883 RepID=A0ABT7N5W0_9BURK|nr:lipoprotein insertase outer membrane protein LolB [Variovorax dokdonensis]MDM0043313.1 lipoprotein insertase outer membrane protein LolB [Variovorax dokdonensis]
MALRVDGDSPQNFSALFDLRGTADTGELRLTSPIGSTLGLARWSPAEAVLDNGSRTYRFDTAGELIRAATGADIPLDALFSWLAGQDKSVPGWRADLSQVDAGRINAWRDSPLPRAELRVIFDTP